MPFVDLIIGARPNFMKVAPIIHAIQKRHGDEGRLRYRLIHTGQHYAPEMSADFPNQLGMPVPALNLEAGPGVPSLQAARIIARYDDVLAKNAPDLCVVVGDVTSTMAAALAASARGIPVAHVEAGLRSRDWTMPEELNRVLTDSVSSWFFTTSRSANANLQAEGFADKQIVFVGNTMIDTLLANMNRFTPPPFWNSLGLANTPYLVATLHRPENVDDSRALGYLLDALASAAGDSLVLFPVHPRTAENVCKADVKANIVLVRPQPYLEFNFLVKHAAAVVTDSGGVTEETTVMGVPCLTLRNNTERPETISVGTNELLGTDPSALAPALGRIVAGTWKRGGIPELWDGHAAERIVDRLEKILIQ